MEAYGKLTPTYFHSINQKVRGKELWGESFEQTCVGLREEVTLLELDMNLQLLIDKLIMQKKGSSNKTSQACTCLSIRHPFPPPSPSVTHTLILSLAVSPDALGSVSPGERYVIHYLTFQPPLDGPPLLRLCFPTDPTLVSPQEVPLSQRTFLHHSQLIDTADRGEFREPGAFTARSFHCSVFDD